MSASICNECEQPCEYGATLLRVCHCDETAGDLRVLIHLRDTEVTRLRAALESIAALQTELPTHASAVEMGRAEGRYEAAEMARTGLGVKP